MSPPRRPRGWQVWSISAMAMVVATAPLGLVGVVPTLLLLQESFGFNALIGLVALSGILMRNTLILIGQIRTNEEERLAPRRRRNGSSLRRFEPPMSLR